MAVAMALPMAETTRPVCRECRWSECSFRVLRVRSYLIAYREALKHGDDPAEYIRDAIRPSRRHADESPLTDALARGTRPRDAQWAVDVKISLERARAAGLSLDAWNAEAVATWLCARANEAPVDSMRGPAPQ